MAVGFQELLQKQLGEIISSVQQEEKRLKDRWQELMSQTAQLEEERAAFVEERAAFEEERAAFEAEKQMMAAANHVVESKVKLDVGGTTYHVSRSTLTSIPGSMLEVMFSGRHTLEEDEDGCVFIDRDGATFKLVLEYLRSPTLFLLDGLSKRDVASCKAEFDYYGLPRPVPPPPPLCLRANTDPGWVSAQLQCNINFIPSVQSSVAWGCAIGAEVLADDAVWKLRVLRVSGHLVMGVIASPTPMGIAFGDATFAGWAMDRNDFFANGGHEGSPGWPGWAEDDEAIFKLDALARRLTVHLKHTRQCYTFSDLSARKRGQWRFCIDMVYPARVVLSVPTSDERALVQ